MNGNNVRRHRRQPNRREIFFDVVRHRVGADRRHNRMRRGRAHTEGVAIGGGRFDGLGA